MCTKKIFLFALMSLFLVSCGQNNIINQDVSQSVEEVAIPEGEKISVTSSIIPLTSIIHTVGGEYVVVNNVVPA